MGVTWRRAANELVVIGPLFELSDAQGRLSGAGPEALEAARERVEDAVGWIAWVEALAALRQPERIAPSPPAPSRPSIRRFHGRSGRGVVAPHVQIHGRVVRGRVPDGLRWQATLEEAAAQGLPAALREALGDADADAALAAVRALLEAPCDCGEVQDPDQHRSLRTLARERYPMAPIDDHTQVAVCTVCARLWTFRTSGDSHYGWSHQAAPFSGDIG